MSAASEPATSLPSSPAAPDPASPPDRAAVPVPVPAAAAASGRDLASDPAGSRRAVAAALLLGVAGAAVVLTAGSRTWQHGVTGFGSGAMEVSVSGRTVTGLPGALALVGLAALVAVFAVRGAARLLVSGLLTLCGAGVVAAALLASRDTAALSEAAANATGLIRAVVVGRAGTAWPAVSAAGGVLLLAAGLVALVHGRSWPGMSSRYDRDGGPAPAGRAARSAERNEQNQPDPGRPEDLWKALDRGEDPTATGPDRP